MTVRKYDHEGRLVGEDNIQTHHGPEAEETLEELLQRTEAELQGHYPMMIDSATQLDAVTVGSDRLHYHYSLLNAAVEDLDVEATVAALRPVVEQQARGLAFLKLLMQKGATISFHYRDKDGKEITVIDVKRDGPP